MELLRERLSAVEAIAFLGNPSNQNFAPGVPETRLAAAALEQRLEVLTAGDENDLGAAFAAMVHRVGAFILAPDPFLISPARTACGVG